MEACTRVSSSRSRARRASRWLLSPMARASSSTSSLEMRRWPPAVRTQGRNPEAVQRRTVAGETPSSRAALPRLRYTSAPTAGAVHRVSFRQIFVLRSVRFRQVLHVGLSVVILFA